LVDTNDNTERVQTCLLFEKKSVQSGGQEKTFEIETQKRDSIETEERLYRDRRETLQRQRGDSIETEERLYRDRGETV
jgi:hypothetical protein